MTLTIERPKPIGIVPPWLEEPIQTLPIPEPPNEHTAPSDEDPEE